MIKLPLPGMTDEPLTSVGNSSASCSTTGRCRLWVFLGASLFRLSILPC